MLEWVESLDTLDTLDSTGRYWIVLEGAGTCRNVLVELECLVGLCRLDRRSPCLLHVELLEELFVF